MSKASVAAAAAKKLAKKKAFEATKANPSVKKVKGVKPPKMSRAEAMKAEAEYKPRKKITAEEYTKPKNKPAKKKKETKVVPPVVAKKMPHKKKIAAAAAAAAALAALNSGKGKGGSHKVISGDTLSQIAKKNGITVKALMAANPSIKNPHAIRVGQNINFGTLPKPAASNPYKGMTKSEMSMPAKKKKKVVKKWDEGNFAARRSHGGKIGTGSNRVR